MRDQSKIIDLYKSGLTGRQIAKIVGLSYSQVYKIIKKCRASSGRPTHNYRSDIDTAKVVTLSRQGLSGHKIARIMGCSSTTIHNRLRDFDK